MWQVENGEYTSDVCNVEHAAALLRGVFTRQDRSVHGFTEKRFHEIGPYQVEYTLSETAKSLDGDREHVQPITINVRVFPCPPAFVQPATAQPPRLRLGQRFNEGVRLVLQDKMRNLITPSSMRGWKGADLGNVRMWCEEYPQLKVSADGGKLQPNEPRNQYQLVGLMIEPSEEKATTS